MRNFVSEGTWREVILRVKALVLNESNIDVVKTIDIVNTMWLEMKAELKGEMKGEYFK